MKIICTLSHPRRINLLVAIVTVGSMMFVLGALHVQAIGLSPAILDLRLNPGQVVERTVTVINTEDVSRTFQFVRENFSPSDEPGVPVFDGGAGDDFPSWISIEPSRVSLSPLGEVEIAITLAIPVDAPRGDFYGVVFAAPDPTPSASARAALLLFLTVLGETRDDLQLVSFTLKDAFTSSLSNTGTIRAQNGGNAYVKPQGEVTLNPLIGRDIAAPSNPKSLRLLAGESREWDVDWTQEETSGFVARLVDEWSAFALGPVEVEATLFTQEGEGIGDQARSVFWVFPWRTALLFDAMFLLVISGLRLFRSRT